MTLLEVMIAMGLMSFLFCVFLQSVYSTMRADRASTMQLHGTVALRSQMEQCIASARDNMEGYSTLAQGLLSYMMDVGEKTGNGITSVTLNGTELVYTFPVAEPGISLYPNGDTTRVTPFDIAVGSLTFYLNTANVPGELTNWNTVFLNGSEQANNSGFNMNGNSDYGGDFSTIFHGGNHAQIVASNLGTLPVRGEIQYFASRDNLEANKADYSIVRNFIVNDTAFKGDDSGRAP